MNGTDEIIFSLKVIIFYQKVCFNFLQVQRFERSVSEKEPDSSRCSPLHFVCYKCGLKPINQHFTKPKRNEKHFAEKTQRRYFFVSLKYLRHLICQILGT